MVRVCEDFIWYRDKHKTIRVNDPSEVPEGKQVHRGFFMDAYLKKVLDSYIYNVENDMDFVIIITGGGSVRVGKSLLAIQIAYYVSQQLGTPFDLSHIVFTAEELMGTVQEVKKPSHSVFIYDEAREAMNSKMAMAKIQRTLQQFFAECGQLNDMFILCLPDFFELNKGMAINRSECLIDCYFNSSKAKNKVGDEVTVLQRGHFRFFKRSGKRNLYLKGKPDMNYYRWRPDFVGKWDNVYPIDEGAYRDKKLSALKNTSKLELNRRRLNPNTVRKEVVLAANHQLKLAFPRMPLQKRADLLNLDRHTLRTWENEGNFGAVDVDNSSDNEKINQNDT